MRFAGVGAAITATGITFHGAGKTRLSLNGVVITVAMQRLILGVGVI